MKKKRGKRRAEAGRRKAGPGPVPCSPDSGSKWYTKLYAYERPEEARSWLPEGSNAGYRELLRNVSIPIISLFFLISSFLALLPLLPSVMMDVGLTPAGILFFVFQGAGGYSAVRYLLLPRLRRTRSFQAAPGSWIYAGILALGTLMALGGWLFRDSLFIETVSLPVFFLSILCLAGGIGIGFERTSISYFVLTSVLGLLLADVIIGYRNYPVGSSLLLASTMLPYVEFAGATGRIGRMKNRLNLRNPETDSESVDDYRMSFLRRTLCCFAVVFPVMLLIVLLPSILRLAVNVWGLKGYPLELTRSIEMDTVYIFILPGALAVSIFLLVRTYRLTGRRDEGFPDRNEGKKRLPEEKETWDKDTVVGTGTK